MEIQKSLHDLAHGRSSITVAHRLSTIVDCDKIVVLKAGKIVEQGTHPALMAIPDGEYRTMYLLQQESERLSKSLAVLKAQEEEKQRKDKEEKEAAYARLRADRAARGEDVELGILIERKGSSGKGLERKASLGKQVLERKMSGGGSSFVRKTSGNSADGKVASSSSLLIRKTSGSGDSSKTSSSNVPLTRKTSGGAGDGSVVALERKVSSSTPSIASATASAAIDGEPKL